MSCTISLSDVHRNGVLTSRPLRHRKRNGALILASMGALIAGLLTPSSAQAVATMLPCPVAEVNLSDGTSPDFSSLDDGSVLLMVPTTIFPNGIKFAMGHTRNPSPGAPWQWYYLNTNGNITFGQGSDVFTPRALPGLAQPTIAVYFGDWDLSPAGATNVVNGDVFLCEDTVNKQLIVTWANVLHFNATATTTVNDGTAQLILRDAGNLCQGQGGLEVEFRYGNIQWHTGMLNGAQTNGICESSTIGISCQPAVAGFDAGDTMVGFQIPSSGTATVQADLANTSNIGVPGVWNFLIPAAGSGLQVCGDGVRAPCEACDDGNTSNDDGCLNDCTLPRCGDGFVHNGVEGCDDGNMVDGDGCNGVCLLELGQFCLAPVACASGFCVDGVCCQVAACAALDQCHIGTCEAMTGLCSSPAKPDGSSCNDDNACTLSDTCQAGACTGAAPMTCSALDQCHDIGMCDPMTGICGNPDKPDGTSCSNGGVCKAGSCVPPNCGNGIVENGEDCDDSNNNPSDCCSPSCAFEDAATVCRPAAGPCDLAESCTGSSSTCPIDTKVKANFECRAASGQCDVAEVCDGINGDCPNDAVVPNDTPCNDANACTQSDSCQSGVCTGANATMCNDIDECHEAGTCDPTNGQCRHQRKPDGSLCTNGICQDAKCIQACQSAADCLPDPAFFDCNDNQCVPRSEGPLSFSSGCACSNPAENGSSRQTSSLFLGALAAFWVRRRRCTR